MLIIHRSLKEAQVEVPVVLSVMNKKRGYALRDIRNILNAKCQPFSIKIRSADLISKYLYNICLQKYVWCD